MFIIFRFLILLAIIAGIVVLFFVIYNLIRRYTPLGKVYEENFTDSKSPDSIIEQKKALAEQAKARLDENLETQKRIEKENYVLNELKTLDD